MNLLQMIELYPVLKKYRNAWPAASALKTRLKNRTNPGAKKDSPNTSQLETNSSEQPTPTPIPSTGSTRKGKSKGKGKGKEVKQGRKSGSSASEDCEPFAVPSSVSLRSSARLAAKDRHSRSPSSSSNGCTSDLSDLSN